MSRKTHLRIIPDQARHPCQSQANYDSHTWCGYADLTVTNNPAEVTCKHCLREMEKLRADNDGSGYDDSM